MITLAFIFAGTTNVFAQYQTVPSGGPATIIPNALSGCTADELHPVQGQVYTYTVNASNQTDVRWFVVNNNDVIANGDSLIGSTGVLPNGYPDIDPSTGLGDYIYGDGVTPITGYNVDPVADATGQFHSIDIAWKYFDGITDQVILVAYAEDSTGCTNNLVVYRIIPEPAFTIDIAVLNDNGDSIAGPLDPITGECVSPIESATYLGSNTTPDAQLTVDYGENWVYYIVNGANYIDSWMPEFEIDYAGGAVPAAAEASWAYLADANNASATWNSLTGTINGGTWTSAVPVIAGGTANNVGDGAVPAASGEAIVVRVRLDWGTLIEHDDAVGILTFAANGIAYDGDNTAGTFFDDRTNFEDLKNNGTVGTDCEPDGFDNDVVDYNITPRPEVENGITTPGVDTEDKTGDETN